MFRWLRLGLLEGGAVTPVMLQLYACSRASAFQAYGVIRARRATHEAETTHTRDNARLTPAARRRSGPVLGLSSIVPGMALFCTDVVVASVTASSRAKRFAYLTTSPTSRFQVVGMDALVQLAAPAVRALRSMPTRRPRMNGANYLHRLTWPIPAAACSRGLRGLSLGLRTLAQDLVPPVDAALQSLLSRTCPWVPATMGADIGAR